MDDLDDSSILLLHDCSIPSIKLFLTYILACVFVSSHFHPLILGVLRVCVCALMCTACDQMYRVCACGFTVL